VGSIELSKSSLTFNGARGGRQPGRRGGGLEARAVLVQWLPVATGQSSFQTAKIYYIDFAYACMPK
jgi:hypothetical protein